MPIGAGARSAIARITRAYPVADFRDPVGFVDDAVMALSDFPVSVVEGLSNPRTGIVRQAKFLPRIAEMVDWCENELKIRQSVLDRAESMLWRLSENERRAKAEMEDILTRKERENRQFEYQAKIAEMIGRVSKINTAFQKDWNSLDKKARSDWELAMCHRLAERPDLIDAYFAILEENPELIETATKTERALPRNGWPKISQTMSRIYLEKRSKAHAKS